MAQTLAVVLQTPADCRRCHQLACRLSLVQSAPASSPRPFRIIDHARRLVILRPWPMARLQNQQAQSAQSQQRKHRWFRRRHEYIVNLKFAAAIVV